MVQKAIVLLSGGQDSTTALYWATRHFHSVLAVSFVYGQRHMVEVDATVKIARHAVVEHKVVHIPESLGWTSALTDMDQDVSDHRYLGLPATYTPGRNIVFLTMAASIAANIEAHDIVAGVCQTDFSGYPDCRRPFIDALQHACNLGMDWPLTIHTPLMYMTKAETVSLANQLPGCWDALTLSITCYHGHRPGCGECPACVLRARGFKDAGFQDPAEIPK